MIKSSTNSDRLRLPFLLSPVGKDYIWGGNRLNTVLHKNIDLNPLAETWECSTHPDGMSIAASRDFRGKALGDILNEHPELLGTKAAGAKDIPILVKFIDAHKDLSVQVHPSDEYARENENGQNGKSEMWYVLEAEPGSKLVYGFVHDMTREGARKSIEDGTITKYLQRVDIHTGEVFFVPAGQVHAICAGALIAEIQQNSNLTYRMYDYDRVDASGKKRALHVEKALDVAYLKSSAEPRQPMRVLRYWPGCASELLCRCKYFQVERLLVNTQCNTTAFYHAQEGTFQVLLCTQGNGALYTEDFCLQLKMGDCVFVPASDYTMNLRGHAELLNIIC